jgi:hypothetical protein
MWLLPEQLLRNLVLRADLLRPVGLLRTDLLREGLRAGLLRSVDLLRFVR